MAVNKSNYTKSDDLWVAINKDGKNALFSCFVAIKNRDNNRKPKLTKEQRNPFNNKELNRKFFEEERERTKHINFFTDKKGGFIRKSELQEIAKTTGYGYNTLRKYLKEMVREGWLKQTEKGWMMISITKLASKYDIDLKILRLKIHNIRQKKDVKTRLANNIIRRLAKRVGYVTDKTNNKISASISCSKFSFMLGYKSSSTGWNREKALENRSLVFIERREAVFVCMLEDFNKDMVGHYHCKGMVYRRPCNEIRPL